MTQLFLSKTTFGNRFFRIFFWVFIVLGVLSTPLWFAGANKISFIFWSVWLSLFLYCFYMNFKKCIFWIKEVVYNEDSKKIKLIITRYDREIKCFECHIYECEFILIAVSAKNDFFYKLQVVFDGSLIVEQYEVAEWNRRELEKLIKEVYDLGATVKIKNLPLDIQKEILKR